MKQKKTLYELLEVPPGASHHEIHTAYLKLSQQLETNSHGLSQEDADIKFKFIKQAYETLSNNMTRSAYDAGLAARSAPTQIGKPFQAEIAIKTASWTPMRRLLTIIASLMAIGMIIQISFMLMAYRHAQHTMGDAENGAAAASKAEEKVILQEYYQENGIRAGSKTEADLLEAEERRKEGEQRRKENEKKEQERKYQQFVEESRRVGDQVSANLRRAEEEAQRAEEYKRQQLEREERSKKEAELARIEREKNKWHSELYRNSGAYR